MDPHVRWLRRFLLGRAVARVGLEAVLVGGAVIAVCAFLAIDPLVTTALGLAAAQLFAVTRLAAAILFNPVNHRYLMSWEDQSGRLQPIDTNRPSRTPLDIELDRIALHHLVRLSVPGPGDQPDDRLDVYASPSRLVVAAVDTDERLSLVSRLTDGRLLVTTNETVPPRREVLLNLIDETSPPTILLRHVELLHALQRDAIGAVRAGYDVVVDQLRLEWSSWNELGPFLGPLLAVDPRPQPHLLQVRPSSDLLAGLSSRSQPEPYVRHRFRTPPANHSTVGQATPDRSTPGRSPGNQPAAGDGPVVTVEVPRFPTPTPTPTPARTPTRPRIGQPV